MAGGSLFRISSVLKLEYGMYLVAPIPGTGRYSVPESLSSLQGEHGLSVRKLGPD